MADKKQDSSENIVFSQPFAGVIAPDPAGGKRIVLRSKPWFQTQLAKFKDGEEVTLVIHNRKAKRSEAQNNFWWVYMTDIASQTGHAPEEVHEWAKGKFLTEKIVTIFGSPTRIKGSTAKQSKVAFSELIMRVEAETGIPAPDPASYFGIDPLVRVK